MNKADRVKESMTDDTETTMTDELNSILPGSNPLENLTADQTGPVHYTVTSARNGSVTQHRVNIMGRTCTCEDMEHNVDGNEVCAHLAYVSTVHPQLSVDEMAVYKSMSLMEDAASLKDQLDMQLDRFEDALVELRDAEAGASTQSGSDGSQTTSQSSNATSTADPAAKAEELQEAYDDVLDDMNVQHHEDYVWVQMGKDTPDELPGPGNVETFTALLQEADQVEYVHDDHAAFSEKPGEWWKNRIHPDDVDQYIDEVLQ